jgi:NSS family neurotransmitter:Na+ symporter
MTEKRAQFGTRLGVIATTVGSAVGLGNIWRFPYETGAHGGGAFLLIYIGFILIIGVPVICAEFVMGRGTHRNIFGAFRALHSSRYWAWVGYMGILAGILILSFYSVVAGWTMEYLWKSICFLFNSTVVSADLHAEFDNFVCGPRSVMWTVIFLLINSGIMLRGVRSGIERASNIFMPLLFLILLIFCANSLILPGSREGLYFLFHPDFSKVDSSVLIGAMGQAFFSLSLGLGTMMTYSSYFSDSTPLVKSAITTASLDTLVAILAGIIIFPAVFTYRCEPTAGPKLVFEVLPAIFQQMPAGDIWAMLFFLLLFLASLTSTISMSELCIAFFCEQIGFSRRNATLINTAIVIVLGVLCALSFGSLSGATIFGLNIFSVFDYLSSNILLPLGGMLISLFVGWIVDRKFLHDQLAGSGRIPTALLHSIIFCLRYIAPMAILLVFLSGLKLI